MGLSHDQFRGDPKTQDAVCRRLEVIGEAAKSPDAMAPELLGRYPDVPWQSVKGMREKLAHDYDTISVSILWNTVMQELPILRRAIESIAADLRKE